MGIKLIQNSTTASVRAEIRNRGRDTICSTITIWNRKRAINNYLVNR